MSYLPKEIPRFWPLLKISGRKWTFRAKISKTIIDRHVIFLEGNTIKSTTLQIFLYLIIEWWYPQPAGKLHRIIIREVTNELRFDHFKELLLLWGSGRAARQDDCIWIKTIIFEYGRKSFNNDSISIISFELSPQSCQSGRSCNLLRIFSFIQENLQ